MYRKQETRPIPPDAQRRTHQGKAQAKIRVDGKDTWCDLTPSGRARIVRAEWYGQLRMADGSIKPIRLCRDKSSAESLLAEMQKKQERIRTGLEIPVEETAEDFHALLARFWKERARSECTDVYIAQARARLDYALKELGLDSMVKVRSLDRKKLETWLDGMTVKAGGHASQGTKNQKVIQLRVFLRWLHSEKLIPAMVDFPRTGVRAKFPRRNITRPELEKLVAASPWPRNIFYSLGFATLARRGALLRIRPEDLNLDPQNPSLMLRARHSKTKTDHQVPIPRKLIPDLSRLVSQCEPGKFIFRKINECNLSAFFAEDLQAAGIPRENEDGRLVVHSLRHGGATELLQRGVSVVLVQRMGGWKNPMVLLKHYAHLSPVRDRKEIDAIFE